VASLVCLPRGLSASQFVALRVSLGVYLAVYCLKRIPYAGELWGPGGMLADPNANMSSEYLLYPPLVFSSETAVQALLWVMTASGMLLALGVARRTAALVLWIGLIALVHRNNLTLNVGLPYLGWLLLAMLVPPLGEGSACRPRDVHWKMPSALLYGAWLLFGLTYTYAGLEKLGAEEWMQGSAFQFIAQQPVVYGWAASMLEASPTSLLEMLSWISVGLELVCLPLLFLAPTRAAAWVALTGLQLAVLATMDLFDLTVAVLLFHALLFDPSWLAFASRTYRDGRAWAAGQAPPASEQDPREESTRGESDDRAEPAAAVGSLAGPP